MPSLKAVPTPARIFGLAGLLPFVAAALACWWVPEFSVASRSVSAQFVLCAYGAVILSFLGGIRWGVAMQHDRVHDWVVIGLAMVPSLVAWPALLVSPSVGILMVIAGMVFQYLLDFNASRLALTPSWFLTLRTVLTAGATLSLFSGWLAGW